MTLEHADYLQHLRDDSARFLDRLRSCDPRLPVPSCPDWVASDLLWHLGEVQWFWGTVVADRLQSVDDLEAPPRPDTHAGLASFFAKQSERLHDALASADPAEPVYMWAADRSVGYIGRRQAHEALIHRLDAELTVGEVTPLDPRLAADGVDEALGIMFGGCPPWGAFTPSGSQVEVRTSDVEVVVPVALGRFAGTDPETGTTYDEADISVRAADPTATAAVTITGTAEDLDTWLWHRRDGSALKVEGDQETFERLVAVLAQPLD
jgi:uncharacterized protein (TIGR03083 family)